ncbi:hypothetical protein G7054_g11671 [Neopestalotiopsis clavispora]|nr:hypothetical protein G7054_g11671 [Neopestalotiopsis clavispora]
MSTTVASRAYLLKDDDQAARRRREIVKERITAYTLWDLDEHARQFSVDWDFIVFHLRGDNVWWILKPLDSSRKLQVCQIVGRNMKWTHWDDYGSLSLTAQIEISGGHTIDCFLEEMTDPSTTEFRERCAGQNYTIIEVREPKELWTE